MHTFTRRSEAEKALRNARLHTLPVEFTTLNGQVRPTVICAVQRDVDFVLDRGFDARLQVAA